MENIKGITLLLVVTLSLTACFLPGSHYIDNPEELAKIAADAIDLKNLQQGKIAVT